MRLHRTIAEILESTNPAHLEARLPELAHHWFKAAQAGDAEKTMRYAVEAAKQALSQHAYEEAVRLYQRALRVSESAGANRDDVEEIRRELAAARSASEPPSQAAPQPAAGVPAQIFSGTFSREGDYWILNYDGKETRLKDLKGLRYIAQLLKAPGQEIHVLELATLVDGGPRSGASTAREDGLDSAGLGDAGEILDSKAKSAYRKRLEELREDLEEAQGFNDSERAALIQEEIEALVDELASAVGIGGRDRKAASQAEKARVNITKAVKDGLKRIEQNHVPLSQHLRATIRTGTYCAYTPDPRLEISWQI